MSIGQGLSSNYYSLIVFVVGVLTATVWIYLTMIKEDDNNNNSDDDPYFSMTVFGPYLPVALSYTCFAHAWLSVMSRIGNDNVNDNGLQQWRKTPIIVASSDAINPTTTTTTMTKKKKLAIITGSNTGIGYETARRLVQEYGWDVILACRSKDKALIAKNKINNYETENDDDDDVLSNNNNNAHNGKAIVLNPVLDLSDFDSIRKFVDAVENEYDNVDVLINNAGRNTSGRSPGNPNLDLMFQSNYLGHFLLTELMLKNKLLLSTTSSTTSSNGGSMITGNKVINLSSVMHHFAKGDNIDREEGGGQAGSTISSPYYWKRRALYHDDNDIRHPNNIYAASKLAAILHTVELNRRYGRNSNQQPHLTAIAVNPGAVNSDIWRNFPNWVREYIFDNIYLSTEQGSEPIVAAAIRNDLDTHHDDSTTSSTTNIGRGTIIYLQPYANPFSIFGGRWFPDSSSTSSSSSSSSFSMIPFTEIFGPYVGHLPTIPRLPKNLKTTEVAAKVLWDVSEELTNVHNEK